MIPDTLEKTFDALKIMLSYEDFDFIKKMDEEDLCTLHHTLGQTIRNKWQLWDDKSPLSKYFQEMDIFHADDMSGIILHSFWRIINGKKVLLNEQVEKYKKFWNDGGCDTKGNKLK